MAMAAVDHLNNADEAVEAGEVDIEKAVEAELAAAKENSTAIDSKRKPRRIQRQGSKENNLPSGFINGPRCWKNSRRSRNGFGRGLPKKGGAGGKGVWGAPGSELLETYEDIDDPNFDNENLSNGDIELKKIVPDVTDEEIKKKIEPIVLEYYENGDTNEASIAIEEAVPANRRDVFVEQCVEIALDHRPSHREMTSVLISDLFGHTIKEEDIVKAFESLLANLEDLVIDIPDAPIALGNFIARAVADDCIPPKFITATRDRSDSEVFLKALDRADTLLSMKHGLVRLHNVWGVGGALRPVKALTRQMILLLKEYLFSGDLEEAVRCVRELEVPHFHHELVYEAIIIAMEDGSTSAEDTLVRLLKAFDAAVIVTTDQMERGFLRVYEDIEDIACDVPMAHLLVGRFARKCYQEGFITADIVVKVPARGRKRFVSEGDQEFIKNHRVL